jgi:hypothetical protein
VGWSAALSFRWTTYEDGLLIGVFTEGRMRGTTFVTSGEDAISIGVTLGVSP